MYFFIKLLCVCFLTLLLLVAELVVEHFTHCLTLLVVAWQTMYRFISLFISCVSLALSHNNSKALEQKVIARNSKSIIFNNTSNTYIRWKMSNHTILCYFCRIRLDGTGRASSEQCPALSFYAPFVLEQRLRPFKLLHIVII